MKWSLYMKDPGVLKSLLWRAEILYGDYLANSKRDVSINTFWYTPTSSALYVESVFSIRYPKGIYGKFGRIDGTYAFLWKGISVHPKTCRPSMNGDFTIKTKKTEDSFTAFTTERIHLMWSLGWLLLSYAFSIHDFEPITGPGSQPPPVPELLKQIRSWSVHFVPRLYDYHPRAIPAPYNPSNIDVMKCCIM